MPKKDERHKIIGSRRRATARYAMICNRTSSTSSKNICYQGVEVRISREDFVAWFIANDFPGCSVDRIDPDGHYELGNIQMISLRENIAKDKVKAKNGTCECFRCKKTKPVSEFVRESRRQSGYSTVCKECERERFHARKNKSPLTEITT